MLALLPPCILAISQMILPPSEPPSWPCGHGRHLPQLLQFNGRRSIAVQPSRHRRRDSPTGPKTGCRLHGPPRSPDAESRPRGAVFGGAAPLAAHAKWRLAPCERGRHDCSRRASSSLKWICAMKMDSCSCSGGHQGSRTLLLWPHRLGCATRSSGHKHMLAPTSSASYQSWRRCDGYRRLLR